MLLSVIPFNLPLVRTGGGRGRRGYTLERCDAVDGEYCANLRAKLGDRGLLAVLCRRGLIGLRSQQFAKPTVS
jgi:hypothetical protein